MFSFLFFLSSNLFIVSGHGYLESPRSRNWVAHQDGKDGYASENGFPPREYCYHCLNVKAANEICGRTSTGNYDKWLDTKGNPIQWNSQATYTEGEIITIKSILSTNHKGHMNLFVCADGSSSTQECFEAHPLEFLEDLKYGAPKDTNYPNRGYYAAGAQDFQMKYKLPMGVTGKEVMMQWRYVTGNSCISPGYLDYPFPDPSWLGGDQSECQYPLDPTGGRCTGCPEQFWNCAEITILPSTGPTPTVSPVTFPPTLSQPPTFVTETEKGCCTIDFKFCSPTLAGWCSESQSNCEGPCDKWWLNDGPVQGCSARYETCTADLDCCSPGICSIDANGLKSCQAPSEQPTLKTPEPSNMSLAPPTPSPISIGDFCCSFDFKYCSGSNYCNESEGNCGGCSGLWINNAPDACIALWQQCSDSSSNCCGPATCNDTSGNEYYWQCQPGEKKKKKKNKKKKVNK